MEKQSWSQRKWIQPKGSYLDPGANAFSSWQLTLISSVRYSSAMNERLWWTGNPLSVTKSFNFKEALRSSNGQTQVSQTCFVPMTRRGTLTSTTSLRRSLSSSQWLSRSFELPDSLSTKMSPFRKGLGSQLMPGKQINYVWSMKAATHVYVITYWNLFTNAHGCAVRLWLATTFGSFQKVLSSLSNFHLKPLAKVGKSSKALAFSFAKKKRHCAFVATPPI